MPQQNKVRVAAVQYFIRPITMFQEFASQVEGVVRGALDFKCKLIVFPEYFSTQLFSLGKIDSPIAQQVANLANLELQFCELLESLAIRHGVFIVAGTIPSHDAKQRTILNRSWVFGPKGSVGYQDKLHMTRFEDEDWKVNAGNELKVFDTDIGKFSVLICYDNEFPELARLAAFNGAQFIAAPSCTDDRQGFLRVRYCAHARAIENQVYVIHSGTVGGLPQIPAVGANYAQAAILTPCDYGFARDGILVEGVTNQESFVVGDMDLDLIDEVRKSGTVVTLKDAMTAQNRPIKVALS